MAETKNLRDRISKLEERLAENVLAKTEFGQKSCEGKDEILELFAAAAVEKLELCAKEDEWSIFLSYGSSCRYGETILTMEEWDDGLKFLEGLGLVVRRTRNSEATVSLRTVK